MRSSALPQTRCSPKLPSNKPGHFAPNIPGDSGTVPNDIGLSPRHLPSRNLFPSDGKPTDSAFHNLPLPRLRRSAPQTAEIALYSGTRLPLRVVGRSGHSRQRTFPVPDFFAELA